MSAGASAGGLRPRSYLYRPLPPTRIWHNGGVTLARPLAAAALAAAAVALTAQAAFTAGNLVSASSVGSSATGINAAAVQPALCRTNSVSPTSVKVANTTAYTGSTGADLIVGADWSGTSSNITISGGGGKDCIVAGAVKSGRTLTMSPANGSGSVCIKGPGPGSYTYGPGCAVKG